jgi:hypothetical protein
MDQVTEVGASSVAVWFSAKMTFEAISMHRFIEPLRWDLMGLYSRLFFYFLNFIYKDEHSTRMWKSLFAQAISLAGSGCMFCLPLKIFTIEVTRIIMKNAFIRYVLLYPKQNFVYI